MSRSPENPRRARAVFARRLADAALVVALVALASPARAQVRMSERATVSQVLDGTTITVEYYRPVARGRDSLFGGVVRWDRPWTPGANWATTIEADQDIRLAGQPLPKGKYSVWMIPRQSGDWTVIIDRKSHRFHSSPPDSSTTELRLAVAAAQRAPEEVLTWSFPTLAPDAAMLRMQWGTTAIELRVAVKPSRLAVVPQEERAPYVGTYAVKRANGTVGAVRIADEAGTLRVHPDQKVYGMYDFYDLLPDGPRRFKRALYRDGQLAEVEAEFTFAFDVKDGRATGFRVLGPADTLLAQATRTAGSAPAPK